MLPQENFVKKALLRRILVILATYITSSRSSFVTIQNPDSGRKIEPQPRRFASFMKSELIRSSGHKRGN